MGYLGLWWGKLGRICGYFNKRRNMTMFNVAIQAMFKVHFRAHNANMLIVNV
jgi:hypothetical protein